MRENANGTGSAKKRIQIKNMPQDEQELSVDEQRNIQGGATRIVRSSYGGTNTTTGGGITEAASGSTLDSVGSDFIEK